MKIFVTTTPSHEVVSIVRIESRQQTIDAQCAAFEAGNAWRLKLCGSRNPDVVEAELLAEIADDLASTMRLRRALTEYI